MKYLFSAILSLAFFLVFRRDHDYTVKTWLYLLIIHTPVPATMFMIERAKGVRIHPLVCFLGTWIGGLAVGFLIGPFLIGLIGGKR